jgi:DNA-binding FrmR family transcriptional regulator
MSRKPAHRTAACACATRSVRRALAVDPDIKAANLTRLRRLEGQVRGIHRMVDEGRYCADIILQVAAAQEALRSVARELLRNHLKHCATAAIRASDHRAEQMYDELVDLFTTGVR